MAFVLVEGNDAPEGAAEHWFIGRGNIHFRVMTAPAQGPARGSVIICPGRTEFIEKYFEVVRDMQRRGFAVFAIDWRGQGMSERQTSNALKGHFDTFDDPVNDLALALKELEAQLPRPHIYLAHSMGGGILLRALQIRRVEADAVMFTSPMWGILALNDFLKGFARFMAAIGSGKLFAPLVQTKWKPPKFKRNVLTGDQQRYERMLALCDAEPKLRLCGPTVGWVAAAADANDAFVQPRALAHIRVPMLITLSSKESLIDNKRAHEVAALLGPAQVVPLKGARHEPMMEIDQYRNVFLDAFDALAARVTQVTAQAG